jgi:hypothetical protein
MQSLDEINKSIIYDYSGLAKAKPKMRKSLYSKMKMQLLERLSKKEYLELEADLSVYHLGNQAISNFFLQEGTSVLNWAVTTSPYADSLEVLCRIIPIADLKIALHSRDCFVLRSFLGTEACMEESNPQDANQPVRINKFKLLLSIDKEGVQDFMQANWLAPFPRMNKSLQEAFSEANAVSMCQIGM